MSVLLIAGSPSERSRTAALLSAAGQRLAFRGAQVETLRVRDLPPQALLLADFGNPAVIRATAQVAVPTSWWWPHRFTRRPTAVC
jgi:FMN reductase